MESLFEMYWTGKLYRAGMRHRSELSWILLRIEKQSKPPSIRENDNFLRRPLIRTTVTPVVKSFFFKSFFLYLFVSSTITSIDRKSQHSYAQWFLGGILGKCDYKGKTTHVTERWPEDKKKILQSADLLGCLFQVLFVTTFRITRLMLIVFQV